MRLGLLLGPGPLLQVLPERKECVVFKLKRPCANCPFKRGQGKLFGLPRLRLREIVRGPAFQCHKTVDYDQFDDPRGRQGEHPQQCAGLMALLTREGKPNMIMRLGAAMGHLDPAALDPDGETYATLEEAVEEHCRGDRQINLD